MKKRIIIFNGVHGAGKSALAEEVVARDNRFAFYPEIGRQVREEVTYNALQSSEPFDREVMRRELARDLKLAQEPKIPLVETWHIGNIGYLYARSPQLIDEYRGQLLEKLEVFEPFCFFVNIDWGIFRLRATEKIRSEEMDELVAFYRVIKDATFQLYEDLKVPYQLVDNRDTFSAGLAVLRAHLDTFCEHEAGQNGDGAE